MSGYKGNNSNQNAPKKRYNVVTTRKFETEEGEKTQFISIGTAFSHSKGGGISVILNALPVNGEIILFPPKPKDENNG